MRGPLIAKDDPPCGIGSRFPRAPTTSDNETMQSVTPRQAREGKRQNFSRGQIDCLSIWTAIFKKCQYVVQPGVSAEEYFERKSGTDNIPAVRAETSLEALVKK